MKKQFIYLLFFISLISNAQKRYWIVNDTRLFEKPSLDSNFHGYFKYGASIEVLSDDESGWIKVKADNNDIGFIKKNLISTSLNASDKITVDIENPIIKGGDSYYGGNHLFVLVAGLKLRTEPNSSAKISTITTTGMPVSISYIPIGDEEWVCVNNQFTLRKFIGNRPNLESLYEEFNKIDIDNIKERKKISERIVELAWNTGYKHLNKAYTIYNDIVNQIGDIDLIEKTEIYTILANGLSKKHPYEEATKLIKDADFIVKNLNIKKFYSSYLELKKHYNTPTKIEEVSDDCGIYLNNLFYYYPNMDVSVDKENNKIEITTIFLDSDTKFKLNNTTTLTHETTEKNFLTKYSQYIDASIQSPNIYTFPLDDSILILEFKMGKLFSVEIMYFC